jgi:hypothetical protein
MQKSHESGLATHIGPESCGAARKGNVRADFWNLDRSRSKTGKGVEKGSRRHSTFLALRISA